MGSATSSSKPSPTPWPWTPLLLLFGLLVLLPGCPASLDCVDLGCALNQQCDAATGLCQPRTRDCRIDPGLCEVDREFCSQASGQCFSLQQRCGRDLMQCPRGQVCDGENGICRLTGLCQLDGDCAPGERCNTMLSVCDTITCTMSSDCATDGGFVCQGNLCIPGCTLPLAPCPQGQFCLQESSDSPGVCQEGCRVSQDCDFGFRCSMEDQVARCVPEGPCTRDEACREDEVCRSSQCEAKPCAKDEECPGAQICDRTRCVGSTCTEDIFSPNHTPAQASSLLENLSISNLVRCPGRADWYAFTLETQELLELTLRHDESTSLSFSLHDESLRLLLAQDVSRPQTTLAYQSTRDQKVLLQIRSDSFDPVPYSLSALTSPRGPCQEDAFEDNDSLAQARVLSPAEDTPITLPLRTCAQDEDWFSLTDLRAEQGLRLSISGTTSPPALELWTPDGGVVAFDSLLQLTRLGVGGTYHIRARDPQNRRPTYALQVTALPPFACLDTPLGRTPSQARQTQPDTVISQHLCPQEDEFEVDWYSLPEVKKTSLLRLQLDGMGAPQAEVALFEAGLVDQATMMSLPPQLVRRSVSAGDMALLSAQLAPKEAGQWLLRVRALEPLGRLERTPAYRLFYTLEQ